LSYCCQSSVKAGSRFFRVRQFCHSLWQVSPLVVESALRPQTRLVPRQEQELDEARGRQGFACGFEQGEDCLLSVEHG